MLGPGCRQSIACLTVAAIALAAAPLLSGGCVTTGAPEGGGARGRGAVRAVKDRQVAAGARGEVGAKGRVSPQQVRRLIADLGASDCEIRREAAQQLGELGIAAQGAIPQLIRYVKDGTCDTAAAAAALRRMQPAALRPHVPALIDCMELDHDGSWSCADVVARVGPAVLPQLEACLRGAPSQQRNLAVYALGRLGAPALPQLMRIFAEVCAEFPWKGADARRRVPASADGAQSAPAAERSLIEVYRSNLAHALVAVGDEATTRISAVLLEAKGPTRLRQCAVWVVKEMVEGGVQGTSRVGLLQYRSVLQRAGADRDAAVRRAAQAALKDVESALADQPPEDED